MSHEDAENSKSIKVTGRLPADFFLQMTLKKNSATSYEVD